ncbi:GntR family transcriptional regulator [Oricola sp.]|uniref:GntR family transcriptional regulator n=1 Tax=Oricola sp. TaxID=1979950 RepID=UPI0025E6943D|nr:GntR family transcriptional regulator [Oricola sp.]MCI5076152.1 GntR family transcriptional regulator [Oricola sp.]
MESVRLEVARRIVSGDLLPGTPLDERQLAADFGVSRTPVREALRVLASSGLVELRAHRKAIVTQPDQSVLSGIFIVMGHLESLCAGFSAAAMTPVQRRALEALHDDMAEMVREGETAAYTHANEAFHNAIYEGTQNAYLAEITLNTRIRLQPFRRAQFHQLGRLQASHAEHTLVVEAILRADRPAAEAAMRDHIGLVEEAWHVFAGDAQDAPSAMNARQEP